MLAQCTCFLFEVIWQTMRKMVSLANGSRVPGQPACRKTVAPRWGHCVRASKDSVCFPVSLSSVCGMSCVCLLFLLAPAWLIRPSPWGGFKASPLPFSSCPPDLQLLFRNRMDNLYLWGGRAAQQKQDKTYITAQPSPFNLDGILNLEEQTQPPKIKAVGL